MKELDRAITSIEHDSTSGSSALVDQLISTLIAFDAKINHAEKILYAKKIEELAKKKPFFSVLSHFSDSLNNSQGKWIPMLNEYKVTYDGINENIFRQLKEIIQSKENTFLLHSHSQTILSAFKLMASHSTSGKIYQTFSKPEGVIQGTTLRQLGFTVEMIDDDPNTEVLTSVNFLITGADLILPSDIINKSGTKLLAEKMNALNRPYIVLSDSRKLRKTFNEVLPPQFELIPRKLVSHLLTGT